MLHPYYLVNFKDGYLYISHRVPKGDTTYFTLSLSSVNDNLASYFWLFHKVPHICLKLLPYDCNFWDLRCDSKISFLKNQTLSCFQWENTLCSFHWLFTLLESPQLYLEDILSNLISRLLLRDWCKCVCVDGLIWMELGCGRFSNITQKWCVIWNSLKFR